MTLRTFVELIKTAVGFTGCLGDHDFIASRSRIHDISRNGNGGLEQTNENQTDPNRHSCCGQCKNCNMLTNQRTLEENIFIRDANIIRRVRIDEILYAEAMGDYVRIVTAERFHAVHTRFATVADRLPADRFVKIHRSYIVAIDKIDTLRDRELMINGKLLPVAISHKQALNLRMNILA